MQAFVTVLLLIIGVIVAGVGLFTLTQATQGAGLLAAACFLAILARMSQAADHQGQNQRRGVVSERGGVIRPPSDGDWPPRVGETLTLSVPLELRSDAIRDAQRTGAIPAGARFTVVLVQPDWLYVQSADGHTEGWAETYSVRR